MTPNQYCRDKVAASGSSFYYSFLFLPTEQRTAITALYAICRELDDIVDECHEPQIALIKLQWWREEIQKTFAGTAVHPATKGLYPHIEKCNLQEQHLQEIINGMQMDLDQKQYEDFDELASYCYRAAGAVGILSANIFGYKNSETLHYAENLGTALQLTNILRDLREDAARGRIYLPQEELRDHGVSADDVLNSQSSENLKNLLMFQCQRAHNYYEQALQALPDEDRFAQRGGLIMAKIYRAILTEIERDPLQATKGRISLTPTRKLWIAWRTARIEKKRFRNQNRAVAHS